MTVSFEVGSQYILLPLNSTIILNIRERSTGIYELLIKVDNQTIANFKYTSEDDAEEVKEKIINKIEEEKQ